MDPVSLMPKSANMGVQILGRISLRNIENKLSPRAIEARVIPTMKGYEYLGFDLDFSTAVYTLKFMRDGVVVWVDVDGRSGQIIGRTGN